MTSFTVIGEPLPGFEAAAHAAAARDLAHALAHTAPRNWSTHLLLGSDTPADSDADAPFELTRLSQRAASLPYHWRTGSSARPRIGELHHAMTPLAPLRNRHSQDDPQISVLIPHALAWAAPEHFTPLELRQTRAFTKRAVKHADVILTPTHAVAEALTEAFGHDFVVQVLPLAAPSEFAQPSDAVAAQLRRAALKLPAQYLVTTAGLGTYGRLDWVLEALREHPDLPDVVVLSSTPLEIPEDLGDRVHVVTPEHLSDVGVVLSAAILYACPQRVGATGYELLGALSAGIPVLYSECSVFAELVLDAGRSAATAADFSAALFDLLNDATALEQLRVLAEDRSRAFSWTNTAAQLWELHANL